MLRRLHAVEIELPAESVRSVRIGMYFIPAVSEFTEEAFEQTEPMAVATAFYYKLDGKVFLVTARHNFTGRHHETGAYLGTYSTGPTHVHLAFREAQPPGGWRSDQPTKVGCSKPTFLA